MRNGNRELNGSSSHLKNSLFETRGTAFEMGAVVVVASRNIGVVSVGAIRGAMVSRVSARICYGAAVRWWGRSASASGRGAVTACKSILHHGGSLLQALVISQNILWTR